MADVPIFLWPNSLLLCSGGGWGPGSWDAESTTMTLGIGEAGDALHHVLSAGHAPSISGGSIPSPRLAAVLTSRKLIGGGDDDDEGEPTTSTGRANQFSRPIMIRHIVPKAKP